ncbi:hypothetical protein ES703_78282 [subsurface metagenome]
MEMRVKKRTAVVVIVVVVFGLAICAAFTTKREHCQEKIQKFLVGIVNGEVDKSWDEVLSGTPIASNSQVVKLLKEEVQTALNTYGKAVSYEFIKEQKYGDSIIRFVYIVKCKQIPLIWEFYFYKAASDWELKTVSVNFKGQYDLLADK